MTAGLEAEAPGDPRWEWVYAGTFADPDRRVKGHCNHLNAVPVQQAESLGGAVVAQLCTDCDEQLPPEWAPDA